MAFAMLLAGCGGGGSGPVSPGDSSPPPEDDVATNGPPTISGVPDLAVEAGDAYRFEPAASDPDGDSLVFSVDNAPGWSRFSTTTGELSGVPEGSDVGAYPDITIRVSDGTQSASLRFTVVVSTPAGNLPPELSGDPDPEVVASETYRFVPTAVDADGDPLTFDVQGRPDWASFSQTTGELSGTPGEGDVGTYTGIVISVSDGFSTSMLGPFDIDVIPSGRFSVTFSWMPPTENTDDSALTDLIGYRVYQGVESGVYTQDITIDNAGLSSFMLDGLAEGTYYFAITAVNSIGIESEFSNEVSATIPRF